MEQDLDGALELYRLAAAAGAEVGEEQRAAVLALRAL